MAPQRYQLDVSLDPPSHHIAGRAVIDMTRTGSDHQNDQDIGEPIAFDLLIHPSLRITDLTCSGATILRHFKVKNAPSQATDDDDAQVRHRIILSEAVDSFTLFVRYDGVLFQNVSAGEKAGEIHNFKMRAHIAPEGIFLAGGYWYPQPAMDKGDLPPLVDFTLTADDVDGMALVASGQSDIGLTQSANMHVWRTPYPLADLTLVGGPLIEHNLQRDGQSIRAYLKPQQSHHAQALLQAVNRYLDRYEPLIGRYPADDFSVVSNFFSSGFAFPMFTLLSSTVIDMGARARDTHGYIDHELLHSWWGNGILVDPRDGNWCESLTSYAANYYGYVLDDNLAEARRKRRNYAHFLSRLKPGDDKPLGTYGLDGGCGRGIAYQKGAAVFQMIARDMGQDSFWTTMRRFTHEYVGRYASWNDIQRLCEAQTGRSYEEFFQQWVRRGGAPELRIEEAVYNSGDQTLTLLVRQGEPAFTLVNVPVRISHDDGTLDVNINLSAPIEELKLPVDVLPDTVEIDPDYRVFRKVPLSEIIPTTASTRAGKELVTVLPTGGITAGLKQVQSVFESSYEEDARFVIEANDIAQGALASRCVLVLGEAARDPYVAAFLSAVECPVEFSQRGFEFDGVAYNSPADAILITVRHPGVAGGGVTIVYGNSNEAVPKANLIPFYEHSIVIFKNRKAVKRRDLEQHNLVTVKRS